MSSAIPSVVRPTDCCGSSCDSTASSNIPGPQGEPGTNGTNGSAGINAFTTTTAGFVQPAVSGTVSVAVVESGWVASGQTLFVTGAGTYRVQSIPDSTHIVLVNLGYPTNAAPTTVIGSGKQVSPGGIRGADGATSSQTLNDISPTTTKGDIIVDNGANNPNAADVRLGVGSDGDILSAVSTQPTGLQWQTLIPTSGTDNGVPRLNGASGTPIPLQTSKVVINDNGAVQASGSGGNARGTDAVDLQVTRAAATQVASGLRAFSGAGQNNTVSGDEAVVVGGLGNTASDDHAFIGAGQNNTASGAEATVAGGDGNSATSSDAFVGGGQNNTASGSGSVVAGGFNNIASDQSAIVSGGDSNSATHALATVAGGANAVANKHGQFSHASGKFADAGDAQATELIWRMNTTDGTVGVEMFLDGSADVAAIPANTSWVVSILLVGRSSAGVEAMWKAEGGIHNNAGTTAVTAAFTVASIADGTGGTWGVAGNFAVTADNAADSLKLAVTGAVATLIRWVAHARIVEVHY